MNMKIKEEKLEERTQKIEKETFKKTGTSKFKPISLFELMAKKFRDTTWAVEKLVPSEGITAISGSPATYKTWVILDLALKVASGDILFDKFVTVQSNVLLIDEENGERLLQKRIKKIGGKFELSIYFLSLKGFILSEKIVADIIKLAKEKKIKLIILDSLVRIHETDENDATKMAGVFKHLKEFNKEGISIIFTHHNRKQGNFRSSPSQNMRGSSDILASVDSHLAIERKEKSLIVTQTKLRQAEEIKPFKLDIISDEDMLKFEFVSEVDEIQTKKVDFQKAIRDLLKQKDQMYKKEIFDALKNTGIEGGYSTFKSAIQEMINKDELFEQRGERNKMYFSLKSLKEKQEG